MVPLCAGIVAGLNVSPGPYFFLFSAIVTAFCFIISLRFNRQMVNTFYGASLSFALFMTGLLLYTDEKNNISFLKPGEAIYSGFLSDYPEEKEKTFKLMLKFDTRISNEAKSRVNGSILLYHKKDINVSRFLPGDRLVVRCSPVAITSRGNPYEFDYRFYMETMGTRYYAFTDSSKIISHIIPEHKKLIHKALIIRERIIEMFRERGIKGDRLALVSAITLGQKNMLDPEQKLYFIKAGIMHIMAVSGLHAIILSLFIFRLLFFLKGRLKLLRVLITLIILWSFAFVTGLTPSVLRATLMYSFLQAGKILKRPVNGINSVLASAFVLIMIRPSVIFDAGFLLSYSAVIYIIVFYRDFYLKIHIRHRLPDWIWQSAAVTIIAQAGTLPLTILLFNRFPTWFILSNVIIVPISSLVIITGCLVPLTYPVSSLSYFIVRILNLLTGLTETLTEKASNLPFSTIDNIGFTTIECILLMVFIYLFTRFLLIKKSLSIIYPITALLLFTAFCTIRKISVKRSCSITVYNTTGYSAIGIRTGRILRIFSDTCEAGPEVKRHCAVMHLKPEIYEYKRGPMLFKVNGENIFISSSISRSMLDQATHGILILTGAHPVIYRNAFQGRKFRAVVVSQEAVPSFKLFKTSLQEAVDSVHYIRKDGAFNMRL